MRDYERKRNFTLTPEPGFTDDPFDLPKGPLRFVIQRHEATRLHFDLRLECDGALKSWAVPKGPSLDPTVKRAAIMVEDHPLDYANFEGRIPKGEYGGGEVVIWDEGTYLPEDPTHDRAHDEAAVLKGLAAGKLSFILDGTRLKGAFTLVRKGATENWLLIKHQDDFATANDPTQETRSVRTGRTAEDLRAGREAPGVADVPGAVCRELPTDLRPMVPTEIGQAFTSDLWTFEPKLDGVRVLALKQGQDLRLVTRNGNDIASRFPTVVAALRDLPADLALDGELVLNDDQGRPSFQALMDAYHRTRGDARVVFWAFDVISLDGYDLRNVPLVDRRELLDRLPLAGNLRILPTFPGGGEALFEEAQRLGMEGIVGKRLQSLYRSGRPSDDWVKIKGYHTEEFLLAGYTHGFGAREHTLGALLLARRDEKGDLRFCGSVGGGLSETQLAELRQKLDARRLAESPFDEEIATRGEPVFARPELVAEVRFMTWTRDRKLRFPVFKRLRPDIAEPAPLPEATTGAHEADAVLEALEAKENELQITVDGFPIRFTSLDKELFPAVTKRDLLRYLAHVSDSYLAYLRDRPLTFVRYPDGIEGEGFFQRHWEKGLPEFVTTADIWSDRGETARRFLVCDNLATLLWLGQISALELHPWHSRVVPEGAEGAGTKFDTAEDLAESALELPDYLVCDLDPNIPSGKEKAGHEPELNATGWARTVETAFALRELLNLLGLRGYPKTSGKTGLHIYIPLERLYDHDQVREAARAIGRFLVEKHPKLVTTELRLEKRPRKVYFDANMNGHGKTLAAAYSPRPVPDARVSYPLTWEELATAKPELYTIRTVPNLLATRGDRWANFLRDRQRLAK